MRTLFFLLCLITATLVEGQKYPAEYEVLVKKADSLYAMSDYTNSALTYSAAFKTFGNKGRARDRYQAARSWALAGVADSAFDCLERIAKGRRTPGIDSVSAEPDLASLHQDKRWPPLMALIRESEQYPSAEGWFPAGSKRGSYHMGIDKGAGKDGKNAATIKSTDAVIDGFGTLMQQIAPGKYRGKKIRMTGLVRSTDVAGWAGLWVRVDGPDKKRALAFDNMQDRPIKGITGWTPYEIVLDVPENAAMIAFGALLDGTGQIWFDAISFSVDGAADPAKDGAKDEPVNLGFDR